MAKCSSVIRDIRFYVLFCQYHRDSSLADSVTTHLLFLETQAHRCAKVDLAWEKMEKITGIVSLYYLGFSAYYSATHSKLSTANNRDRTNSIQLTVDREKLVGAKI